MQCSRSKERHRPVKRRPGHRSSLRPPVATTRSAIQTCGPGRHSSNYPIALLVRDQKCQMIFTSFWSSPIYHTQSYLYLSPPPRLVISRRAPRDMFAASIVAHAGTAVAARGECDAPAPSPPTNPFAVPRRVRAEGAPPKGYGNAMWIYDVSLFPVLFNFPRRG